MIERLAFRDRSRRCQRIQNRRVQLLTPREDASKKTPLYSAGRPFLVSCTRLVTEASIISKRGPG